ncbi:MAG: 50S ribosomal protein L30 [Firmicutes bacterium]|nr:50S ribosomal protein L30 [Bacillota bacterium]
MARKARNKQLTLTWKRSIIGQKEDQKATIAALGFRRLYQTIVKPDTPEIRGMVKKVEHLLEVTEE